MSKPMSKEERLLRAIFADKDEKDVNKAESNAADVDTDDDDLPDNYPETYVEKAHYAQFLLHKTLESLSPALTRISRLHGLLQISQKDGKNTLPEIITNNESRMALKHLAKVKEDVNKAYCEICQINKDTKELDKCIDA